MHEFIGFLIVFGGGVTAGVAGTLVVLRIMGVL